MIRRRTALSVFAVVVVLAGLVPLGRWEGRQQTADVLRGLVRVRTAVGSIDSSTLTGVRRSTGFNCLLYQRGPLAFALELCFDARFRLLEASDRRFGSPHVYTLRLDPSAATIVLPANEVHSAIETIRRTVVRSAWQTPVQYLNLCTRFALAARVHDLSEAQVRARAHEAAGLCAQAIPPVAVNASYAAQAGSPAVALASRRIGTVLRDWTAAASALERQPNSPGRSRFARSAAALEARIASIVARLHAREPWLTPLPKVRR